MKRERTKQIRTFFIGILWLTVPTLQSTKIIKKLTITTIPKDQPAVWDLNTSTSLTDQLRFSKLSYDQRIGKGILREDLKGLKYSVNIYHRLIDDNSLAPLSLP